LAYVEWDEKYSVRIKSIDDQHKKLFELINGFYGALKDKGQDDSLKALLAGLVRYIEIHFAAEEDLMHRASYAGLLAQVAAHAAFTEKVRDMQRRHAEGKLVLSVEITGFLKKWLTEHILASDLQYVDCMIRVGAA
jgi:hemerythrin